MNRCESAFRKDGKHFTKYNIIKYNSWNNSACQYCKSGSYRGWMLNLRQYKRLIPLQNLESVKTISYLILKKCCNSRRNVSFIVVHFTELKYGIEDCQLRGLSSNAEWTTTTVEKTLWYNSNIVFLKDKYTLYIAPTEVQFEKKSHE